MCVCLVLAVVAMCVGYVQVSFWLMTAERQTRRIRKELFRAILRQEMSWFDTYKSGELANRLTELVILKFTIFIFQILFRLF